MWMASTLQVLLSILIRIKRISNETATTLSIRASQQKDDIPGCLLMGIALISQSTKATEMVYLLGALVMAWLSRRARQRFDVVRWL
jgi:hypothetical protein